MKKITLILITLFTTGTMLMAQGGQRGPQRNMDPKARAEHMTERMVKEYSLNDTQKQQLLAVNLAMAEKMKPAERPSRKSDAAAKEKKEVKGKACCEDCANCENCKDNNVAAKDKKGKKGRAERAGNRMSQEDREKFMAEMKKSREDYDGKIKQIFTKDQYESYTKKQAERQNRMADRGRRYQQRTNN